MKNYSYKASIKSKIGDELLNTYFIRPFAGLFVNMLFNKKIKPIQVVIFGSLLGLISAYFYSLNGYWNLFLGASFLFAKNISDAVDGQLARAKNMVDRRGRFLDSIADIIINFLVFLAISLSIYRIENNPNIFLLCFIAFISISLRVSYFVFYLVSYLKLEDKMKNNRIIETITDEDKKGDKISYYLQIIFNIFYTWQDKFIYYIDKICKPKINDMNFDKLWYSDVWGLRLNNFIGLGTELTLLIIMSYLDMLKIYLYINIVILNLYLVIIVLYRKFILSKKILNSLES